MNGAPAPWGLASADRRRRARARRAHRAHLRSMEWQLLGKHHASLSQRVALRTGRLAGWVGTL